jgi:hypothetical protein
LVVMACTSLLFLIRVLNLRPRGCRRGQTLAASMVAKNQNGPVAHEIADGPVHVVREVPEPSVHIGQ